MLYAMLNGKKGFSRVGEKADDMGLKSFPYPDEKPRKELREKVFNATNSFFPETSLRCTSRPSSWSGSRRTRWQPTGDSFASNVEPSYWFIGLQCDQLFLPRGVFAPVPPAEYLSHHAPSLSVYLLTRVSSISKFLPTMRLPFTQVVVAGALFAFGFATATAVPANANAPRQGDYGCTTCIEGPEQS
uniref:Uncharacterized protein n=1 Tax=Mycena chlorophos TaxID=658473 RepID=A0ABQ0LRB9_MYCCL|nr:predicted protein [Mycena chlorophos]